MRPGSWQKSLPNTKFPMRLHREFSAYQKSLRRTFLTASTAEHFDAIKMLLRSKSLIFQAFLRRVIVLRDGPFLAAARSRCGSDMPPACHSLPQRRFATSRALPLLYFRRMKHGFLTVSYIICSCRGTCPFRPCGFSGGPGSPGRPGGPGSRRWQTTAGYRERRPSCRP